jgi:hypothetical protein
MGNIRRVLARRKASRRRLRPHFGILALTIRWASAIQPEVSQPLPAWADVDALVARHADMGQREPVLRVSRPRGELALGEPRTTPPRPAIMKRDVAAGIEFIAGNSGGAGA